MCFFWHPVQNAGIWLVLAPDPAGTKLRSMRQPTDAAKVEAFMTALGRRTSGPGRVYFTGGASAVLVGWRNSTADIDLKLEPEPAGAFEALAQLKDELDINIELAAPDQFIPPLNAWQERSQFIGVRGAVEYFHYDFLSQALSKLERGHNRDLENVRQMLLLNLTSTHDLENGFAAMAAALIRYPAVDARAFRAKVEVFLGAQR